MALSRSRRDFHGRGLAAAENDVKAIAERMAWYGGFPIEKRDQAVSRVLVRDAVENGVEWQQRISRKIHLRDQARQQPRAEERKVNVRGAPGILMILPRVLAGFYGDKTIAALGIGEHASAARKIRIERRAVLIHSVPIAARRVGLPNLHQRSGNGAPFFIQYAAAHDDAFAEGLAAVLVRQVIIVFADVAMAEDGAGELRQCVRQENQRLFRGTLARGDVRRVKVIGLRSGRRTLITGRFNDSAKATVTGEGVSGQAHAREYSRRRVGGVGAPESSGWLRRFREVHIEFFEGLHDDPGNSEIAEPFVVGRNDEPRRIFRAAAGKQVFVGGDVLVPTLSLRGIGFGKFPFLARIVKPLVEAFLLLLLADVQEKFQNRDVVFGQISFKTIDFVISSFPNLFRNEFVHAYDEDILVMRAVKNTDHAPFGNPLMDAP